jgi:dTDP-4-amino-4,6-dideoxygalactose transaminase
VSVLVVTHLLARAADVERLARTMRALDPAVRVIEDAAQAWPGERAPSVDALLFSFARGKPLPLGGGGALAHGHGLELREPAIEHGGWPLGARLAATCVLARPRWYRLPESLPWLGVGETTYEPRFDLDAPLRSWQVVLGTRMLPKIASMVDARTRHAARLAGAIAGSPEWTVPSAARASGPLRFPVLAPSRAVRDAAIGLLRSAGVAASRMYPSTLAEIPALRPYLVNPDVDLPGARAVAERLLTLPTYPTLADRDVERIAARFHEIAGKLRA